MRWRERGDSIDIHLAEDAFGLALPDFIGNPRRLLLLSKRAIALITKTFDIGPHEVVDFTLINHKHRVHSRDYAILNPLFTPPKPDAPARDLQRWDEDPTIYLVSQRFIDFVAREQLTNFSFEPLDEDDL